MTVPFEGALGYGAVSVGGTGGEVIYVTTLEDSLAEGTFRHALAIASGPRIVRFAVTGYINLLDDIAIVNPYITIEGHEAPGDGVCVRYGGISIRTNDVIIRYLRVRPGDQSYPTHTASDPEDRDCIKIQGGSEVILDHCSFTWAVDECVSTWVLAAVAPTNITIQNCIIAEGLYTSIHPSGNHSRGLLIGDDTTNVTVVHNLIMSNNRRSPMIKGGATDIYIYNNLIYNWGADSGTPGGVGINFSDVDASGALGCAVINNIVDNGPNGGTDAMSYDTVNAGSSILLSGNSGDLVDATEIAAETFVGAAPAETSRILTWASGQILGDVGAKLPVSDGADLRLINEAKTGQGSLKNTPGEAGGYPQLNKGKSMAISKARNIGELTGVARNTATNWFSSDLVPNVAQETGEIIKWMFQFHVLTATTVAIYVTISGTTNAYLVNGAAALVANTLYTAELLIPNNCTGVNIQHQTTNQNISCIVSEIREFDSIN